MGGARKGAGRKAGSKDSAPRRTAARKIAAAAAEEGILPAEIMLRVARYHWERAIDPEGKIIDETEAKKAFDASEKAAPYFNAKLATIEHSGKGGGPIEGRMTVRFVKPGGNLTP